MTERKSTTPHCIYIYTRDATLEQPFIYNVDVEQPDER